MPYATFSDLQSNHPRNRFDFIIVGAGSAGCPLASRLSEDLSVTVLLIEAGPRHHGLEETLNSAIPAGVGKLQHSPMDWAFFTEPLAPHAALKVNTFEGAIPYRKHRSFWPRGKGMGGCSLINYFAWVRGHPNDYNEWETKHGAKGWGWQTIGKLFEERIEDTSSCDPARLCSKCRRQSTTTKGPYGISHKTPVNSLVSRFLQACSEVGFEQGDYNCSCNDVTNKTSVAGLHQLTVRQGTRCTAARVYIDPLMDDPKRRPNLTVLTGAKCQQILTSKNNDGPLVATGVRLVPDDDDKDSSNNVMELLCGKEVILSAGALGSPQILLQSGIGPKGDTLDLPQVGQNLQDHVVTNLRFPPKLGQGNQDIGTINQYKAEALPGFFSNVYNMMMKHEGMLTSAAYDASVFYSSSNSNVNSNDNATANLRPNLQISCLCATADKQLMVDAMGWDFDLFELDESEFSTKAEGLVFCCTLLRPKSRGSISLAEKNDKGNNENHNHGLVIHANYLTDKDGQDVKELVACVRQGLKLAFTKPYQDLIKPVPFWPKDLCRKYNIPCDKDADYPAVEDYPDAFLEELVRRHALTIYHPASTCRMGRNAKEAVVDHTLKVFGVGKLRIADASIQPEIVSANTQASCVVIGERAADIIREEYSLQSNPQDLLEAVANYENAIRRKRWTVFLGGMFVITAAILGCTSMILGKIVTK